jgi:3'(2'), 5'-bisphosphate nucleotidase
MNDHELAHDVATTAGELLLSVHGELTASDAAPSELRDEGDRRAHEHIVGRLATERGADAILSEEGADDTARLTASRVWIVDPLDGTREFSEGRTDWAVHVALWEDGALRAGAVALPAAGRTLSTAVPSTGPGGVSRPPRMVVSRTRSAQEAARLATILELELVAMGSAGAKAMAVVQGHAELYVHSGGQYEWDSAAPVAVAAAAGFHVSRLDGSRLVYNREDSYLPDLLICHPDLATTVLAALGGAVSGA